MIDGFHRPIDYIRLSVTDRCNLRCRYCMPPDGISCIPMTEILTYEEIVRLCRILADMGIHKIKVTGGEPFARKGICRLIEQLKAIPGIDAVTLTTNGILALPHIPALKQIGIDGINFSLDTLNPETFFSISGSHDYQTVINSIYAALDAEIPNIKINCVPMSGINDSEIPAIAELAKEHPIHVRFIEMMPIGFGKNYTAIPEDSLLRQLEKAYGTILPVEGTFGNGPAKYYHIPDFKGHIGFISAMSHRFCESCNRIRLTSDGHLKTCLFYENGTDLKYLLRNGFDDNAIVKQISSALQHKPEHHDLQNQIPESKGMSQIGG